MPINGNTCLHHKWQKEPIFGVRLLIVSGSQVLLFGDGDVGKGEYPLWDSSFQCCFPKGKFIEVGWRERVDHCAASRSFWLFWEPMNHRAHTGSHKELPFWSSCWIGAPHIGTLAKLLSGRADVFPTGFSRTGLSLERQHITLGSDPTKCWGTDCPPSNWLLTSRSSRLSRGSSILRPFNRTELWTLSLLNFLSLWN